jgi:antitoxin component HigA of HigAB toxin-antitoxin module
MPLQFVQYRTIKSQAQYKSYESYLVRLLSVKDKSESEKESIESLISLIKKWDEDHNTLSSFLPIMPPIDPLERLVSLMKNKNIRPSDLAIAIKISQTALSDILNHKRNLTPEIISRISKQMGIPLVV